MGKPNKLENLTKDILIELYINKRFSQNKISKMFNVTPKAIKDKMISYNIESRGLTQFLITENLLRDLFINKKMSIVDIAKKYGCTDTRINQLLKKYNITWEERNRNDPYYLSYDILYDRLIIQGLSVKVIAEEFYCDQTTVRNKIKEYKLDTDIDRMKMQHKEEEKKKFYRLFVDNRLSVNEIANMLNMNELTVRYKLNKCGINIKEYSKRNFNMTKDEFYDLYIIQEIDIKDIAEMYNANINSVQGLARKYKINKNMRNMHINISHLQEELIIGSILGDGHIRKMRKTGKDNASLSIQNAQSQLGYLTEKYNILKELCMSGVKINKRNEGTNKQATYYFSTKCFPQLNKYYDMDKYQLIDHLTDNILCIWYLDDGTVSKRSKNGNGNLSLSAKWLREDGIIYLQQALIDKFQLETTVAKPNGIPTSLSFDVQNSKKLSDLIRSCQFGYIAINEMSYKLL